MLPTVKCSNQHLAYGMVVVAVSVFTMVFKRGRNFWYTYVQKALE